MVCCRREQTIEMIRERFQEEGRNGKLEAVAKSRILSLVTHRGLPSMKKTLSYFDNAFNRQEAEKHGCIIPRKVRECPTTVGITACITAYCCDRAYTRPMTKQLMTSAALKPNWQSIWKNRNKH